MPGIDSVTETPDEPHDERTAARNARIGLILFVVYVLLYGSFVLLNAFAPDVMVSRPVAGLNLSVLYGLGLIFAAFALALLYGWLCRKDVDGGAEVGRIANPSYIEEASSTDSQREETR